MIAAAKPLDEQQRLADLLDYRILDSMPEDNYDQITRLASAICGTGMSIISLIDADRQWIKSRHGIEITETGRDVSFCAHAILHKEEVMVVNDSRLDIRFHDNPLVTDGNPCIIFYAAVPLVTTSGSAVGTLCILDSEPKQLGEAQINALRILAEQVMVLLELRKKNHELNEMYNELLNNYHDLEQFSYMAAHDLKSPLHNITALVQIINMEKENVMDEDTKEYLGHIANSSLQLTQLISDILEYSKATQIVSIKKEAINLTQMLKAITMLLKVKPNVKVIIPEEEITVHTSKIAIKQILLNLITNAIKYNNNENGIVEISYESLPYHHQIKVADNGNGIPPADLVSIFDLFKIVKQNPESGTGIGLSIVKRLVSKLGGTVDVASTLGVGTTFTFTIRK